MRISLAQMWDLLRPALMGSYRDRSVERLGLAFQVGIGLAVETILTAPARDAAVRALGQAAGPWRNCFAELLAKRHPDDYVGSDSTRT